ncbi:SO_0444 family Cu/Zn efflux transporter [Paraglaciecola aquimarina]|uniref:SO_0444 family Cu/Zn efflux transporter n=1 Tax=Paraglaciecola aquimarina TaxID=1235557 RepID=A0ABU3SUY7_9ALTE|nr:SO_0444 family Cu/Zn efflux transporter [Paraglaciecola aquimarina]MDU0353797.1 SO_0444 family Cu/Zn efflux transporter [Paraglaciecola aquimarina]
MELLSNFVDLFTESAPFLLLGMLMAGVINQLVPKTWIDKTLGSNKSVTTAALIGAPLPLCSCSVIPVAMGIRRSGASKASTASFLVATPETGVDSIGVTYALMGPIMAIVRPIAAIFSAIVTGLLIAVFGQEQDSTPHLAKPASVKSCCSKSKPQAKTLPEKIKTAVVFGYGQLLRDFMVWFLIGVFFAALITTYVPDDFLAQYAQGVFAMLVAVVISIPMYICATASTPIAVGLLMSGISPGAALVFMLTGPATNIATLMIIKNELGKRELALYLVGIVSSAILCGVVLDYLFSQFGWQLNLYHGGHSDMLGLLYQVSAFVLAGLIIFQMFKKYWPKRSLVSQQKAVHK